MELISSSTHLRLPGLFVGYEYWDVTKMDSQDSQLHCSPTLCAVDHSYLTQHSRTVSNRVVPLPVCGADVQAQGKVVLPTVYY